MLTDLVCELRLGHITGSQSQHRQRRIGLGGPEHIAVDRQSQTDGQKRRLLVAADEDMVSATPAPSDAVKPMSVGLPEAATLSGRWL